MFYQELPIHPSWTKHKIFYAHKWNHKIGLRASWNKVYSNLKVKLNYIQQTSAGSLIVCCGMFLMICYDAFLTWLVLSVTGVGRGSTKSTALRAWSALPNISPGQARITQGGWQTRIADRLGQDQTGAAFMFYIQSSVETIISGSWTEGGNWGWHRAGWRQDDRSQEHTIISPFLSPRVIISTFRPGRQAAGIYGWLLSHRVENNRNVVLKHFKSLF